jgi:Na+-driven multidrug efflux pump
MGFLSCLLGLGGLLFVLVCVLLYLMADDDPEMTSLAARYLPLMALPNLLAGFSLGFLGRMAEARLSLAGILVSGSGLIVAALLLIAGWVS